MKNLYEIRKNLKEIYDLMEKLFGCYKSSPLNKSLCI